MKRLLGWGIATLVIMGIIAAFFYLNSPIDQDKIPFNYTDITLTVLDSPEELTRGLSGTSNLPQDQGMLFIFSENSKHGIWMKEMNYPIDIIWIDEQKKVVDIKDDVSPDTYPTTFYPKLDARYVIELAAGTAKAQGISTGQQLDF